MSKHEDENENKVCTLCGGPLEPNAEKAKVWPYGNNPEPLGRIGDRCCDKCDWEKVIPARMGKKEGALGTFEEYEKQFELLKQSGLLKQFELLKQRGLGKAS